MALKFYGINEINQLQFTYNETMDENIMYVGVNAQSDTRKTSEDLMLLFTKEQVIEMYASMMRMEENNSEFLKK